MVRHHNATVRGRHPKNARLERQVRTANVRSLKLAAKDLGVTQKEIADNSGYTTRTVGRWFSGKTKFVAEDLASMPRLLHVYAACFHKWVRGWAKGARRNV